MLCVNFFFLFSCFILIFSATLPLVCLYTLSPLYLPLACFIMILRYLFSCFFIACVSSLSYIGGYVFSKEKSFHYMYYSLNFDQLRAKQSWFDNPALGESGYLSVLSLTRCHKCCRVCDIPFQDSYEEKLCRECVHRDTDHRSECLSQAMIMCVLSSMRY